MFRRLVSKLRSYSGRVKVGVDKYGNSYYRRPENVDGALVEKRWVEFNAEPDPTTVPVEWTSWLSGTRKEAPTKQEILDLEAHRQNVRMAAALYEKEEEIRRVKAKLSQQGLKADDLSLEDMQVMLRQISGGESRQDGSDKFTPGELSHSKYTKGRDGKESAEPSVWHPRTSRATNDASGKAPSVNPSDGRSSDSHGQGDNFEPGTWRP
ncbi:NADH dehydrogenase [ubiquinone] 1 alpha subcomplex assembly factor 2 [Marchantia polymorpha subsp. ruderalis]|uniref:NADH dehydrogenase [ubiquinone] 1 alpha subcomplex subunit 12 n=2 Tax=Marchantia polymorpha TaxID=3197 RepID=A0A176VZ53_MARPO|nr:hypothetical protein AXG93_1480s1080 [Marchantia polymorpha subsp. ruderalis]PTQ32923.1 hypothetical protein MARPO_0093s0007 [Marchantia polymorpha]BBN11317.1 hypothetical protein Mp_5g10860 [Marchantia polymorpha subsp. ruderalis]|eukprot:PTQ32923.1 hypothetical protein MARPO_0093s0007 [Marchantia polymorpha]